MATIGVIGGHEVNRAISLLEEIYADSDKHASVLRFEKKAVAENPAFDIIIISNDKDLDKRLCGADLSGTKIFIVNADLKDIFNRIYSINSKLNCRMNGKIITYGFNPKSCVTVSAATDALQYCIQRSLPTFGGEPLYEQEFSVNIDCKHPEIDAALAAVTAALVDGIDVKSHFRAHTKMHSIY